MNPNSNEAIQLPTVSESLGEPGKGESQPRPAEASPSGEQAPRAAQTAAIPTSIPLPTPPVMPQIAQPAQPASNSNPAQASDDTDLIEKEWVNKAKAIVERTKDDPYKQTEELTVFKADYMKKRYNRAVKLSK